MVLIVKCVAILWLVFSIVLYIKRKYIVKKYNIGYISSFVFTAYMLFPILSAFSNMALQVQENGTENIGITFIYPIVGIIIFFIINSRYTWNYIVGKFFSMLAIGVCSGFFLIFDIICSMFSPGGKKTDEFSKENKPTVKNAEEHNKQAVEPERKSRRLYDEYGKYQGYIDENGRRYDSTGKYQGYVDKDGRRYDSAGKYQGYTDTTGRKYNSAGKYIGYVDEQGRNYAKSGKYQGYSRED